MILSQWYVCMYYEYNTFVIRSTGMLYGDLLLDIPTPTPSTWTGHVSRPRTEDITVLSALKNNTRLYDNISLESVIRI
jgi:hypothetical protein